MKYIYSFILLCIGLLIFAQSPQGFSYQAIAFDSSGNPIQEGNVAVRISILDESATGTTLYTETHSPTTNAQGLFSLNIGLGTPTTGTFSDIDWGTNAKFIQVELDPTGGTNYTNVGTNQLMSVPYALYAENGGGNWSVNSEDRLAYEDGDVEIAQNGSGLWLTSPNGTKYEITVNDAGELSLPTSNASSTAPTQLYLYGSFNDWDATNALQFNNFYFGNGCNSCGADFFGFRYFEAGTEIKFLAAQNESVIYGGNGLNGGLTENGNAITIPSDGFYVVEIFINNGGETSYNITSSFVEFEHLSSPFQNMLYDVENNRFSYLYDNPNTFEFVITGNNQYRFGDNISNQQLDLDGNEITPPSGMYYVTAVFNFDGTGEYEVTPFTNAEIVFRDSSNTELTLAEGFIESNLQDGFLFVVNQDLLLDFDVTDYKLRIDSTNPKILGRNNGRLDISGDWIPIGYDNNANIQFFFNFSTGGTYSVDTSN